MKKVYFILTLLLVVLCSGCCSSWSLFSTQQPMDIQKGMSLEEVQAAFGKPSFRSFHDNVERWEFRRSLATGWSVTRVYFVDGKVDEMEAYFEHDHKINIPNCTNSKASSSITIRENDKYTPGSVIVTPEGKHAIVASSVPGIVVTTDGQHIHVAP